MKRTLFLPIVKGMQTYLEANEKDVNEKEKQHENMSALKCTLVKCTQFIF